MVKRGDSDVSTTSRPEARRQAAWASSHDEIAGGMQLVSPERLKTNYEQLRRGIAPGSQQLGPEFPLLVAVRADGDYEVLDGFKRLARWREQGHRVVPVLVESVVSSAEHKRWLLRANAPARTSTALDEARVVCSLRDEEKLGPSAIGRLLGHKPQWVERRLMLGRRLSRRGRDELGRGGIGPTLGHALCRLEPEEQDRVLEAIARHQLGQRDALALVHAWESADENDRRELLREPLRLLRPDAIQSQTLSPRVRQLEAELERLSTGLKDLTLFTLPDDLAPPERRRLEALWRGVLAELRVTAQRLGATDAMPTAMPTQNQEQRCDPTDPTKRPDRTESNRTSFIERAIAEYATGNSRRSAAAQTCGDSGTADSAQEEEEEDIDQSTSAPTPRPEPRDSRAAPQRHRAASLPLWLTRDCPEGEALSQGRDPRIAGDGPSCGADEQRRAQQTGAIPRGDPNPGGQEAHHDPHPAGDSGTRLRRGTHDPGQARA